MSVLSTKEKYVSIRELISKLTQEQKARLLMMGRGEGVEGLLGRIPSGMAHAKIA